MCHRDHPQPIQQPAGGCGWDRELVPFICDPESHSKPFLLLSAVQMKWFALLLLLGFLSALDSAVMRQRRSINSDAPEPNQKPGMALYGAGAGGGTHTLVASR
ncbi:hypothetical protein niasHT_028587 [Heterodera trifolii]|uniref:Uncharacterized protein n=1 Tax=Heterodera trifolii TaxID=157864 RepID=A0ABD2KA62_9BILA